MITIDDVKLISEKISLENGILEDKNPLFQFICALCNLSLAQEEEEIILYQNEEESYKAQFEELLREC